MLALRTPAALAGLILIGCHMPNPAFDRAEVGAGETRGTDAPGESEGTESAGTSAESGSGESESGESESGESESGEASSEGGCVPPKTDCQGSCVDLSSDPLNCGECGLDCAEPLGCFEGVCGTDLGPARYVFATSIIYAGHSLGPLSSANALCQFHADQVWPGRTFKAWLSDGVYHPALSYPDAGPWILADGSLVALGLEDLLDGSLAHPISLNEHGQPALAISQCGGPGVWSAILPEGTGTESNCGNWSLEPEYGQIGHLNQSDASWTLVEPCMVACSVQLPIYCFEQ